ncbi:MAG: coniferyl aldehyde dehydrogenase, partial [Deltaproteobacteria bacterium]|nr:coniferyl aldehyde dehydrogenase [Deltaproteobacteria bacterium]NNK08008.1 coniferyl aldehyde dehydrogenase [Myxococcales bacterium]MBT8465700.1 coniferyl aldehyde dehydrogenase [Deltaproteobacteria bacterium]MBT8481424.1 coniferyl aldehyde dehydrogenase [Deltaproteobacteria bacterium]NNK44240.1 coniferyl aldehyde dehydrogenase [Myxococcales bacterium]
MAQTAQIRSIQSIENEAQRVYTLQREAYLRDPYPSLQERRARLNAVERILLENTDAIVEAISQDFGHRCAEESKILEIFPVIDGLRHTRKKLRKWMKPQRRPISWLFATGSNRLIPQPKGVVGIVSPWNYPLFLTLSPLVSVLAAGNRAMIKMASNSQHLCRLLADKFGEVFPEEVIAILPGVRAGDFSTLPYDHIIFTGSADVGRTVMQSAAENLTPVTLELGGKSPTIVCDDFDIDEAASRIMYAKLVNAGQTCLAPDYLFLPNGSEDRFVAAAQGLVAERYPDTNDESYTSVIDDKAYRRLRSTLEDAEAKGATLVPLVPNASFNDVLRKVPPHLVLNVTEDMMIMKEEIFGPLFPVMTYKDLDETIEYVTHRDRPLGFYVFTNDRARKDKLLYSTISGGVTINNCIIHVAQHDLPFGGVGASGIGHYHGYEGFVEFSKMRPVFTSPWLSLLHWFYPPYTGKQERMIDLTIKLKP